MNMVDYRLTPEGEEYLRSGLPEKNLMELLSKGPLKFDDAKRKIKNFVIALQWVKKKNLVKIEKGTIHLTKRIEFEEQKALSEISQGKKTDEELLKVLMERKLVEKVSHEMEKLSEEVGGKQITQVTPQLLKTGIWKKARGFAPYDTHASPAKKIFQGKLQPYRQIINDLREKLIGLGFVEARGPYVESEFWNFDALFIPQDHPARTDLHDTFNIRTGSRAKIREKDLWSRVKATQEFGWTTGSRGWGRWDASVARNLIMRSQNTAVSARKLSSIGVGDLPYKMFVIDRVFRKDVIDAQHLIDFDQCEGIVAGKDLHFRHLLGYLKEIGKMLGAQEINFKPSYFPFTEPSLEVYAKIEGHGWVEIGGAGMMRPEVISPLGVEVPVLAWGIGIGRLAMIKLRITDIRQLYTDNIGWLREKSVPG